LTVAAVAGAGCSEVKSEDAVGYQPASLSPVAGSDGLQQVTFSKEGAERTGLRTAVVGSAGGNAVVPYASLLYGPTGETFVYTQTEPLSFVREDVEVDRIDGSRAVLSAGPAGGTQVVTIGAAEVYGAELEIAGDH
jgi:hypothetical protein